MLEFKVEETNNGVPISKKLMQRCDSYYMTDRNNDIQFYGSYNSIAGGLCCFAMSDLTGGIPIHNQLKGIIWNALNKSSDGRYKY